MARIHLVADPAPTSLRDAYQAADAEGRKEILSAMDSLNNNPRTIGEMKAELRRLEAWERDTDEWIKKQLVNAPPPPDPRRIRHLLQTAELDFIERISPAAVITTTARPRRTTRRRWEMSTDR